LAYVDFDGDSVLRTVSTQKTIDEEFLSTHCPNVIEAVEKIAIWLDD
jgi:hypothetical protein